MRIIPMPVKTFISNPKTAEFVENTFFAVTTETILKMVGRPMFILIDKEADSKAKRKYAAGKEFLYQALCLGLYLIMVPHIKNWLYSKISQRLSKDSQNKEDLELFNREYQKLKNLHTNLKQALKNTTDKTAKKQIRGEFLEKILQVEEFMKGDKRFALGKGAKELSAIIASVATLAILAPQISHYLIHPSMKLLGFKKEDKKSS